MRFRLSYRNQVSIILNIFSKISCCFFYLVLTKSIMMAEIMLSSGKKMVNNGKKSSIYSIRYQFHLELD
jgi:hypothetical protein